MSILYIDRKGTELRSTPSVLSIYEDNELRKTVPLRFLDRLVLRSEIMLSSSVLGHLSQAGVGTLILSGRKGNDVAHVFGRYHNDARIRLAQYQIFQDDEIRNRWSGRLIRSKLLSQIRFLERAKVSRKDLAVPITPSLNQLKGLLNEIKKNPEMDRAAFLGMEGAASHAYFSSYFTLFSSSLGASGRNRRPPRDPVNACLSLGYTLLHFEGVRTLHQCGLDPLIGFFHEPSYSRESLACDMIEPLRPKVDDWVWESFRTRLLREDHFLVDKGACLLGKTGRSHFYTNFEPLSRSLRKNLLRECRLLAKAYLLKSPDFPVGENEEVDDEDALS